MGKKGKKTRWRRLPIGGTDEEGGLSLDPPQTSSRITFNEDEYTKITTPRQDVLFKKGYFGRKRAANPSPADSQETHSGDSVESESYAAEEPQYVYPAGYMDASGVYYVNGNAYETYDPYTGTVTVVVGPAQYPHPGAPVLAALPCQPVPLQPLEYCPPPWYYSCNRKKRYSTDSQNCSAQSSESTGPPGSPQEPIDEGASACAMYPPQYVYPGYMFGPPIYNMNGVTVQGMIPQPVTMPPDPSASKRRKKRRRRRRGGITDDGSESSCCEEQMSCDMAGEMSSDAVCQSGASSDTGDKANSDSGINTDPTPNSGSNSPPLTLPCHSAPPEYHCQLDQHGQGQECDQFSANSACHESHLPVFSVNECMSKEEDTCVSQGEETPEEVSEELSTAEEDVTPNLCVSAPEFSSQESTLSCLSTPGVTKDLLLNDVEMSLDLPSEERNGACQSVTELIPDISFEQIPQTIEDSNIDEVACQPSLTIACDDTTPGNDLNLSASNCKSVDGKDAIKEEETTVINIIEFISPTINSNINEIIPERELEEICVSESLVANENFEKSMEESILCTEIEEGVEVTVFDQEENDTYLNNDIRSDEIDSLTDLTHCSGSITPVPPPRRKRSLCRAAERVASKVVHDAISEGIEEAAYIRLKCSMPITEAVTRWLNSQGNSPLTLPPSDTELDSEDEGIEAEEELTDQKNVQGNPFLVSSHSDMGQRVAKDCVSIASSAGEWDIWDSHTREMCDPTRSVDKYYRLGADDGAGDKVPPSVYKTAMHIRHTGPFPCGVCCIIQ